MAIGERGNRFNVFLLVFVMSMGGCLCDKKIQGPRVCFRDQCFDVEVVQKPEELTRGLMERDSMEDNHGMLFVFPESRQYSFWMKDTLIPLDMIWMDYGRNVVHIAHDVPPCEEDPCPTYAPPTDALYVLEINAGLAQRFGITQGDRAEFKLIKLP